MRDRILDLLQEALEQKDQPPDDVTTGAVINLVKFLIKLAHQVAQKAVEHMIDRASDMKYSKYRGRIQLKASDVKEAIDSITEDWSEDC